VSVRRILNVPKRGIGDRAEAAISTLATAERITFFDALQRADEAPGLASRSVKLIQGFVDMMNIHRAMVAAGKPADEVLTSILKESNYLPELEASTDPQDETRIENLIELVSVAAEFVAAANTIDLDDEDATESGLVAGMPEPDDSLAAFLERIALVADSDQVPDHEEGKGVVTLMTLHTAKGLEFDTVFLTGMEEGMFPHMRALTDPNELEEERRLAYVGITRARKRLYISRSSVRVTFGQPAYNPASRFIDEMPAHVMDWRRTGSATTQWASSAATRNRQTSASIQSFGSGRGPLKTVPSLAVGDRVLHASFGMGTVTAVTGGGENVRADVDFGSAGTKRLSVKHAPMEKL
ncbi:MAG TPA: ATP-binding domain-containing protein, partial [Propionibacterium sp.]|nr:ATP-binding domain-containing protein [Propionibacterium sp.]